MEALPLAAERIQRDKAPVQIDTSSSLLRKPLSRQSSTKWKEHIQFVIVYIAQQHFHRSNVNWMGKTASNWDYDLFDPDEGISRLLMPPSWKFRDIWGYCAIWNCNIDFQWAACRRSTTSVLRNPETQCHWYHKMHTLIRANNCTPAAALMNILNNL